MGFHLPQLRYRSPFVQNIIAGICVGFSAGIYVALNLYVVVLFFFSFSLHTNG